MIIAKQSFNNLYESEVYRELERQAVRKGFFKPTSEQVVKLAHQQVSIDKEANRKIDCVPSDDLTQDIARLIFAMKRKGFDKVANEIEDNLIIFKQAETSLYNLKPDDVVGFSHRDGDVDIVGLGDLGTIETVQSAAEKILAVVRKEPKKVSNAELASMIIKKAQEAEDDDSGDFLTDETIKKINTAYVPFNDLVSSFPGNLPNNVYFTRGKLSGKVAEVYSKFTGVDAINVVKVDNIYNSLVNAGQTGFDAASYKKTIINGANDASKIRENICVSLGFPQTSFMGVSKYIVNGNQINQSDLDKLKVKVNIAEFNPSSVYTQEFDVPGNWTHFLMGPFYGKITTKFSVDNKLADTMAEQMSAKTKSFFDAVYGPNNSIIDKANADLQALITEMPSEVSKFKLAASNKSIDKGGGVIGDVAFNDLYVKNNSLKKYFYTGKGKLLLDTYAAFGIQSNLGDFATRIDNGAAKTEENLVSMVGSNSMVDITHVNDLLTQAYNTFTKARAMYDNNSSDYNRIGAKLSAIISLRKKINNIPRRGSNSKLKNLFERALPEYKGIADLESDLTNVVIPAADKDLEDANKKG